MELRVVRTTSAYTCPYCARDNVGEIHRTRFPGADRDRVLAITYRCGFCNFYIENRFSGQGGPIRISPATTANPIPHHVYLLPCELETLRGVADVLAVLQGTKRTEAITGARKRFELDAWVDFDSYLRGVI